MRHGGLVLATSLPQGVNQMPLISGSWKDVSLALALMIDIFLYLNQKDLCAVTGGVIGVAAL